MKNTRNSCSVSYEGLNYFGADISVCYRFTEPQKPLELPSCANRRWLYFNGPTDKSTLTQRAWVSYFFIAHSFGRSWKTLEVILTNSPITAGIIHTMFFYGTQRHILLLHALQIVFFRSKQLIYCFQQQILFTQKQLLFSPPFNSRLKLLCFFYGFFNSHKRIWASLQRAGANPVLSISALLETGKKQAHESLLVWAARFESSVAAVVDVETNLHCWWRPCFEQ